MKHNKKTLFGTILLATLTVSASLFLAVSTIIPVLATVINIQEEETAFIAEIGGYHYKCYSLTDEDDHPISGVAIAWNEDPTSTPETLTIPATLSYGGGTYDIKGIAKAGFRYCQFKEINLPQSIQVIKEEAFAYCEKLEMFKMPSKVTTIAASTFLDCRALEYVKYTDEDGNQVLENESITRIEDHAFDSCVSLKAFTCPKNVVYFGESCFQKCELMPNFFFPKAQKEGNQNTNPITVRSYAFADCKGLISLYFETNMNEIDDYAFVDCHSSLTIRYTGYSIPTYYKDGTKQNYWRRKNIASDITNSIDIIIEHPEINTDSQYPCLHYSEMSDIVKLDSTYDKDICQIELIDAAEIARDGAYAVINGFDIPSETVPGCYDVSSHTLTIPDEIDGLKVKVIDLLAFAYNEEIEHVVFGKNLVQIRHHAFYRCTSIKTLTFAPDNSTPEDPENKPHLKEISYQVFQDKTFSNTNLTQLLLPDSLEFVGDFGLTQFTKVSNFHMSQGMRAIGDCAFFNLGNSISATVDMVLPNTLNDEDAAKAYFMHISSPTGNWPHTDYTRWYAIGRYAFTGANCLRTVVMEEATSAQENDNDYATSMFSNAFKECKKMLRFQSCANLKYIGKDAFKTCDSLKEIFLSTKKAETAPEDYPWCINENTGDYGGTLFFGACADLVVYLDGEHAPGELDNYVTSKDPTGFGTDSWIVGHKWNAETGDSYRNEVQEYSSATQDMMNRSTVPTYYGVDFDEDLKYWNTNTKKFLPSKPTSSSDYNAGIISLIKTGTNEYTVGHFYYSGNGGPLIDLTIIPGISDDSVHYIKTIGPSAFGKGVKISGDNNNKKKAPGLYFVLPESITTISERAFYRRADASDAAANGRFGVRILTYKKSNGNVVAADGTTELVYPTTGTGSLDAYITALETQSDANKRGYCVIPPNVTSIGKLAFYDNIFSSIYISASVSFIGHGAFYTNPKDASNNRTTSTIVTFASGNSNFSTDANSEGIYYTGGGNSKKILMYQTQDHTGSLTIASDTKAIGLQGCANTKYTSITLPTGLTTIYGAGFAKNYKLTTLNTVSSVRYISCLENPINSDAWDDDGYTEVWDASVASHFDNSDYRDVSYDAREIIQSEAGAFYNCTALTTLNFKTMTELRKIGWYAFANCSSMNDMVGGTTYVYKEYDSKKVLKDVASTDKTVLDLSGCSHLRSIDVGAFLGCTKVKFLHLPDNKPEGATESNLYIGADPEAPRVNNSNIVPTSSSSSFVTAIIPNNSVRVLLKETADYASKYATASHKYDSHYVFGCFSSESNNTVFYYAHSADDVLDTGTSIKYWTKADINGVASYVLLTCSANDARTFINSHTIVD